MTNQCLVLRTASPLIHPYSPSAQGFLRILLVYFLSIPLPGSSIQHAFAEEQVSPSLEQQLIATRGLAVTPESLRKVLGESLPANLAEETIPNLIQALGSESYADREAAMEKILKLPAPPIDLLEQAKAGDDLEIRMRAARILKLLSERTPTEDSLVFACLLLIRKNPSMNMTEELLQMAPLWNHPTFRRASWLAMERTARAEDLLRFNKALTHKQEAIRAMALVGLLALGDKSDRKIEALEKLDPTQQPKLVQFVLLKHRLEQADMQSLAKLVSLCYADDAALRALAIDALHRAFDSQKISKDQLLREIDRHTPRPESERGKDDSNLSEFADAAWEALLARIAGKGMPAPKDWADYLSGKLLHGNSEGQPTAFTSKIPTSLLSVLSIEKRTANTTNSVTSRHGTSPWLYPTQGKNEAPQVLCEKGSWYFPIYGTWRQHWGSGWNNLDENGLIIKAENQGGPHIESEVDYFVIPMTEE